MTSKAEKKAQAKADRADEAAEEAAEDAKHDKAGASAPAAPPEPAEVAPVSPPVETKGELWPDAHPPGFQEFPKHVTVDGVLREFKSRAEQDAAGPEWADKK